MNLLDFNHRSGWPGSSSTWEFIQGQILLLQQLSLINGSTYIINGCVDNAGSISDGTVVVAGEILPFVGGAVQTNVVVVDTVGSKEYFDHQVRPYYHTRIATFGTVGTVYAWADFDRSTPTNGLLKRMKATEDIITTLGNDLSDLTTAFGIHTHTWASITGKPNNLVTYAGSVTIGDITEVNSQGGDKMVTVSIPNQGDNNYIVAGSIFGIGSDPNYDNDVMWIISGKAADQFVVAIRSINLVVQNLKFEFAIVKLT
jgi:hypothetical protein